MSTGGNVPTQGVVVEAATSEKKCGNRSMGRPNGYVGKGTAGSRLKSAHRKMKKSLKVTLREFAVHVAKGNGIATKAELQADAKTWLERKGISA